MFEIKSPLFLYRHFDNFMLLKFIPSYSTAAVDDDHENFKEMSAFVISASKNVNYLFSSTNILLFKYLEHLQKIYF